MRFASSSLLVALVLSPCARAQDNILLIVADDLGVDYVGVYAEGPAPAPTPNIDALASRGVLFRNGWANPSCTPTRACFHTGRVGYRTGAGAPGARLDVAERTLPELLDETGSGYSHALIGKWHLGTRGLGNLAPNQHGWSHFAGLLSGGVQDYYSWTRVVNGASATSTTYATTQITDDAIAWIQSANGPWFCTVAYNAPHDPFHVPPANLHTQNVNPASNSVRKYRAAVQAMDTEIGRLLVALGPAINDTTVIFMGDNGTPAQVSRSPFISSHAKGSPYEGGVNVPLIVAGPSVAAGGRESAALVHAVDLFATVAELAGSEPTPVWTAFDSVSFAPLLGDPNHPPLRDVVYTEQFQGAPDTDGTAAVRDATYKLIRRYTVGGATDELYDLIADPFETNDLLAAGPLGATAQQSYSALSAEIARIRDTSGRFTVFGSTSCVGSNGNPSIGGGVPAVGQSYTVTLSNAVPLSIATLSIGASTSVWSAIPLPFALQLIGGGPGCFIHASGEIQVGITTGVAGGASVLVPVPASNLFVGAQIHHNWLMLDPAAPANPLGVVATPGATAVPGL